MLPSAARLTAPAAGLLLALLAAPALHAQIRPLVHPGNRVRIVEHAGGAPAIRTVFDVRGDTLLVGDGTTSGLRRVRVQDVRRVHVSRGLQRNTGRGMRIGFAAAAPIGAVIGARRERRCDEPVVCLDTFSREERIVFGAAGAGVVGGAVGAVVGAQTRSERWERVRIGRYPAMAAGRDGVSIALHLPI